MQYKQFEENYKTTYHGYVLDVTRRYTLLDAESNEKKDYEIDVVIDGWEKFEFRGSRACEEYHKLFPYLAAVARRQARELTF